MKTPRSVKSLELVADCTRVTQAQWDIYMKNATKADKRRVDRLVKIHLPILYHELALDSYNPYNYYKTKNHLILVHSSIEYFIKFKE